MVRRVVRCGVVRRGVVRRQPKLSAPIAAHRTSCRQASATRCVAIDARERACEPPPSRLCRPRYESFAGAERRLRVFQSSGGKLEEGERHGLCLATRQKAFRRIVFRSTPHTNVPAVTRSDSCGGARCPGHLPLRSTCLVRRPGRTEAHEGECMQQKGRVRSRPSFKSWCH